MPIASLAPANSMKARTTAINSFTMFLAAESLTHEATHRLIDGDKTCKVLRIILDKYAYSLATSAEKVIATNTCIAYYGNVKNWLVDKYLLQGALVKSQLQNILSGLGKYCSNREELGDEKKAPPCSKEDLEAMVSLLYSTAATESEYLYAALVVMMWYLYGRSSDAEAVEKSQLSILPGGVLFLRFKRVKTALLQGISLFKDPTNCLTCPLQALAVALIMQKAPSQRMLPQFIARKHRSDDIDDVQELTLIELLEVDDDQSSMEESEAPSTKQPVPGAQAYVNRLLVSVKKLADLRSIRMTPQLISHSF
ncbi:hypothetical protein PHYSODRAFT_513143 [Phytophthora sojae]|uniref:Uncharacterized protein n=1 Tax=Phytophthora sojae (strain P6497) TaxID=1094619 RepID=G4ZSK0_PHYSP|nr:hypothetical protein PHYSODRAFT_513143 [Phytophthora sojae]EGZ14222.1 hypothetical protein PHYSODRAFT_513143 [Phytophthora sojae]|eukprot:XP_009531651.1 hypothetical protein PHYSODRAFT_513143 [Phytophthora sojae]